MKNHRGVTLGQEAALPEINQGQLYRASYLPPIDNKKLHHLFSISHPERVKITLHLNSKLLPATHCVLLITPADHTYQADTPVNVSLPFT